MSLEYFDGFDHYATAQINWKWDSSASATIAPTSGRRGGGALSLGSGASANKDITASQRVIVGIAISPSALPTLSSILNFYDDATLQVSIKLDADGSVKAYRGDTTELLGSSAASAVSASGYQYLDTKVKIDATTGSVEVHAIAYAGAAQVVLLNLSGVNTGTGQCTSVQLAGIAGGILFDDLYICRDINDGTTNFLGDSRIDTVYPEYDGYYQAFEPSTGADHFSMVNEAPPDSSDYNAGAGLMDRDSYLYDHVRSVTGTIKGVQVNTAALKTTSYPGSLQNLVRAEATDGYSEAIILDETAKYARSIHEQNPATGSAWTELQVNQAEYGARVA